MWHCTVLQRGSNISEKPAASIFRVEEYSLPWRQRQQNSAKFWYLPTRPHSFTSQKTIIIKEHH